MIIIRAFILVVYGVAGRDECWSVACVYKFQIPWSEKLTAKNVQLGPCVCVGPTLLCDLLGIYSSHFMYFCVHM